jgi:excinuclease UvrABC nuclease subunit
MHTLVNSRDGHLETTVAIIGPQGPVAKPRPRLDIDPIMGRAVLTKRLEISNHSSKMFRDGYWSVNRRLTREHDRRHNGHDRCRPVHADIPLIDGGQGQLSSAVAAFQSLKVVRPTVIAPAKREEEIYVQGRSEPIVLSRRSFALRLLRYVGDKAHRFAQHYHHLLRKKLTLGDDG